MGLFRRRSSEGFQWIELNVAVVVSERLREGIDRDRAKKINKMIKDKKLKVQSQIQGEQLRITGKKIDDLQSVISTIKEANLDIELQYVNMKN